MILPFPNAGGGAEQPQPGKPECAMAYCHKAAEFECRVGDNEMVWVCARHAASLFPGVPLSVHRKL